MGGKSCDVFSEIAGMKSRSGVSGTNLIRETSSGLESRGFNLNRPLSILSCLALLGFLLFLVAPGTIGFKAHLALHGICAQRPSHSFWLGDAALPLDARMTGIYLAAATTIVWLAAIGRLRATMVPSPMVLTLLALFVAVMGIDGTNGLLADLGGWHLYVPNNLTRLTTGILAGTCLGVGIAHIFALSMWANPQPRVAVVERMPEILPPILIAGCFGLVASAGLPSAFDLFAVGLVAVAVVVFWLPSMVIIALFTGKSWLASQFLDLGRVAVSGLIVAVFLLTTLSILRSIAEQTLGLPKLT
jgi:uncharacterized membrane protein